jgi:hypothetical protein
MGRRVVADYLVKQEIVEETFAGKLGPSLQISLLTLLRFGAGERCQVKGSDPYIESLIGVCHSKGLLGQRPGRLQTTSSHLFSRTRSSRRLRCLVASLLARRSLVPLI